MQNQTDRAAPNKQQTAVNPTQVQQEQRDAHQNDAHRIAKLDPEQVEKNRPADADPDDPVSP